MYKIKKSLREKLQLWGYDHPVISSALETAKRDFFTHEKSFNKFLIERINTHHPFLCILDAAIDMPDELLTLHTTPKKRLIPFSYEEKGVDVVCFWRYSDLISSVKTVFGVQHLREKRELLDGVYIVEHSAARLTLSNYGKACQTKMLMRSFELAGNAHAKK